MECARSVCAPFDKACPELVEGSPKVSGQDGSKAAGLHIIHLTNVQNAPTPPEVSVPLV